MLQHLELDSENSELLVSAVLPGAESTYGTASILRDDELRYLHHSIEIDKQASTEADEEWKSLRSNRFKRMTD